MGVGQRVTSQRVALALRMSSLPSCSHNTLHLVLSYDTLTPSVGQLLIGILAQNLSPQNQSGP